MTWTAEELAALRAAVATGVLTVSYAGPPARTITYQSLAEMRKLLNDMDRSVNGSPTRYRHAIVKKGFRGC